MATKVQTRWKCCRNRKKASVAGTEREGERSNDEIRETDGCWVIQGPGPRGP